jgi:hypothetical protein
MNYGRYNRWIELDPERSAIWRYAWNLLLTDKMTLDDICEALHERGYRLRSGRPFVQIDKKGNRTYPVNTLSRIFHNWTYAGWVVSEGAEIPPKTIQGDWEPLVTTDEFERGLAILDNRNTNRDPQHKHFYLLTGRLYVQRTGESKLTRLTGSTPNSRRKSGGTPYYCVRSTDINLPCQSIDEQVANAIMHIQVDPDLIPAIRQHYTDEIEQLVGTLKPDERQQVEAALRAVDEEEARTARLFAAGKITEAIWDGLWREWQDRRQRLRDNLEVLERQSEYHIDNLDAALHIISRIGVLYQQLDRKSQKKLLREMIERIVVDVEGTIIRIDLLPPFAYLHDLSCRTQAAAESEANQTKTSPVMAGSCSTLLPLGVPGGIRTHGLLFRRQAL